MAIGKRIKFFRKRNRLTMKALGMFLGFKESNAESRMSQYETEQREPRRKMIRKMAESLGIVPEAITRYSYWPYAYPLCSGGYVRAHDTYQLRTPLSLRVVSNRTQGGEPTGIS